MDFKRFPWDLIKTLKPTRYSAAGGIEIKIDCMHADIVGTREALPAQLPEMVAAHWIENGAAGQMKEAA
jgi:hypothetical protein